ncbi:MAG TPA: PadR family transcriptional regulator [Anaerolineales bacterium]|nr:PadR family transcriptional regulator [Anaerolineales bacterium]
MERELLLLGLLRQRDMHGYVLYEFIERDLAVCTDLKKSTAYYLLDKMAARGWIQETKEQEGNRPPRRVYSLTEKGERQFLRLLEENLSADSPVFFPGDAGLAFLDALPPEKARRLIQRRRQGLAASLAQAQAVPEHGGSLQLAVAHRVHHLKSELDWLDHVLQILDASQNQP